MDKTKKKIELNELFRKSRELTDCISIIGACKEYGYTITKPFLNDLVYRTEQLNTLAVKFRDYESEIIESYGIETK